MSNIGNDIFALVLMPFDKAFDDVYKLGIKETAAQLEIKAERVIVLNCQCNLMDTSRNIFVLS